MTLTEIEEVVLLDDDGRAIGRAPKSSVHGADTALHLAFSCHVLNERRRGARDTPRARQAGVAGRLEQLVLRSPAPGRAPAARGPPTRRVRARARRSTDIELALPLFRYRATDANGIVEHELCPVYTARTDDEPVLNPLEVVDAPGSTRPTSRSRSRDARGRSARGSCCRPSSCRSSAAALDRARGDRLMIGATLDRPIATPRRRRVADVLDGFFARTHRAAAALGDDFRRLWRAARDAAAGGKRLRPALVLAAHRGVRGDRARPASTRWPRRSSCCTPPSSCTTTSSTTTRAPRHPERGRRVRARGRGARADADGAARLGDAAAILAGDLLLSEAFRLVADARRAAADVRARCSTIVDECVFVAAAGELADVEHSRSPRPGERDILD